MSPSSEATTSPHALILRLVHSVELRHAHRLPEALACLDDLVAQAPSFAPGRLERALVLAELKRYDEALADCDHFLAHSAPARELTLLREQMLADALADYGRSLAVDPADRKALLGRANLLRRGRDFAQAERDYRALLDTDPMDHAALAGWGDALLALERCEDACASYERLLALAPERADAWFNYGNVLARMNRIDDALTAYRRAIDLQPDFAEAHVEVAHCRLMRSEFADGWREYEWRWRTEQMQPHRLATPAPAWRGDTDLRDKTILLWAEQGYGDTIQFARFARRLADRARRVVLRVPAALRETISTLDSRIEVIADGDCLPMHDLHCPLMSLPYALGLDGLLADCAPPYLVADAQRVQYWAVELAAPVRPRIGLVWAGKRGVMSDTTRHLRLAALAPLFEIDAEFVCLQKDIPAADAETVRAERRLRMLEHALDDFADTAALIAQLDLVISVDTAVAHLAGALGTPCWVLLKHACEWRWQCGHTETPWYPSLRLFRQRSPGEWDELVARVDAALRDRPNVG